jgi:hypothetical protein
MTSLKIFNIAILFSLFICASGQTVSKKTIAENYKTKQFNCAIFPSSYIDFPIGSSDRFTPTPADVDKAEMTLKTKLAALTRDNPTIYKNLKHYRRQYLGYKNKDGQRILIINCMRTNDEDVNKNWLNKYIMTLDGGSNYWNVNFNLETNAFFDLNVNGDA